MTPNELPQVVAEMHEAAKDFDAVNWASVKNWADRLSTLTAQGGDGDWYTTEEGSHCVDLNNGPARQLSLLLKKDGTVRFAAYVDGKGAIGDAAGAGFWPTLATLTTPPAPSSWAVEGLEEVAKWHRKMNLELSDKGDQWAAKEMWKCPHGRFATALEQALASTAASGGEAVAPSGAEGEAQPGPTAPPPRTPAEHYLASTNGVASREWNRGFNACAEQQVPWIRRWEGSGTQRGFHILDASRLTNKRHIAYLGDQVSSEAVDALINEHNATLTRPESTSAAPAMPDGFVMVPREPTPEMLSVGGNGALGLKRAIWGKMIAIAELREIMSCDPDDRESAMVLFFRSEGGAAMGRHGDAMGWSPEQTARHFLAPAGAGDGNG